MGAPFTGAGAAQAPKRADINQPIDSIYESWVVLPGAPATRPVRVKRLEPFQSQPVAYRATARVDQGSVILDATGRRFVPEQPANLLISVDWRRADPPFYVGRANRGRLMGELFCGWGRAGAARRLLCFRDANQDGAFEAFADGTKGLGAKAGVLSFAAIQAIAYARLEPAEGRGAAKPQRLSFVTTSAGKGKLRVLMQLDRDTVISGDLDSWVLAESTAVDAASLPTTATLYEGSVSVLRFDSKTAVVQPRESFRTGPFSLVRVDPEDLRKGYTIGPDRERAP